MCDVLWPCDQSAAASTSFDTTFNSLVSSTTNFITRNSTSASSSVSARQFVSIEIDDQGEKCPIDVVQKINITSQVGVNLSKSTVSDLRSHITNDLTNAANQNAQATATTMGGSSSTATNTSVTQNIQNIVNQNLTDETYTSMASMVSGDQNTPIKINKCRAPIRINQDFCATVLATNIVTLIADQLGGTDSETTTSTTVDQDAESKSLNPIASLTDMFSSFGAIGGIICLICVLMSCAGAAFLAYMMFGPKSAST